MSTVYATDINDASFRGTGAIPQERFHFNTDLEFNTDFTLSLVSGTVVSGNSANLQTGDVVCSGAELQVTPTVTSRWATPDLDIVGSHIWCDPCTTMISYSTINTNRDVAWLAPATFDPQDTYATGTEHSQDTTKYSQLGTFHDQSVTYSLAPTIQYTDMEGGANIFCKGQLEVRDGTTTVGSPLNLPSTYSPTVTLTTAGSHAISTRINNADCFGVMVKHPVSLDYPSEFWMNYYANNVPTAITGGSLGLTSKSITVQSGGGDCNFRIEDAEASGTVADEDLIKVCGTVHNDGDPMEVTDVSSSNAGFTVDPFPPTLCDTLGLPPSFCPADNGFNTTINTGNTLEVCVILERQPGATGGTVLTFNGETAGGSCGGSTPCSATLDIGPDIPFGCAIEPPALTYATLEVAEFLVACTNIAGDSISCIGDNWYFADGVSGDFWEKDNTHALAYPTSPAGSEGTLNYESEFAHCWSNITVVHHDDSDGDYVCEFIPSSDELETGETRYFVLNCFHDGVASVPDDADYDLAGGLDGSLSNDSTNGVLFEAGANSSGDLRGFAYWNDASDDPILGAMALADITIGGGDTNITDGDPDIDDGPSEWCTIGDGLLSLNVYPGWSDWLSIGCGSDGTEDCEGVVWWIEPPESGSVSGDDDGAWVDIDGTPGTNGRIVAVVTEDNQGCSLPFWILIPNCWEFT